MKKMLLISACLLSLLGCGGSGSDDVGSGSDTEVSSPTQTGNFAGTWSIETKLSSDPCNLLRDSNINDISGHIFIGQSATDAVIFLGGAKCAEPFNGPITGNDLLANRVADFTSCSNGSQAALVEHIAINGLDGDETDGITISFEIGCPDRYCRYEFTGTAKRTSADNGECFSQSGVAAPSTPTPHPTSAPNLCDRCNLQGCCSHHAGVDLCPGGPVICFDGTTSGCSC